MAYLSFRQQKHHHPLKEEEIPGPGGFNDDLHFRPSERKKKKNGTSIWLVKVELHDNLKEAPNQLGQSLRTFIFESVAYYGCAVKLPLDRCER